MAAFTSSLPLLHRPHLPSTQQTQLSMSTSRPSRRNNRRPPPKRGSHLPQSSQDVFQLFDEDEHPAVDPEELSDVDDGFFSRYMREREQEKRNDEPPRKRMDRETAAIAFDAVDKLFGSMNPDKKGEERRRWLDDVQARAATSEETRKGEALDVDAEDVDKDEFTEVDVEGHDAEHGMTNSETKEQTKETSFDDKYSFEKLVKIARRGPPGDNRKRIPRSRRDTNRDPPGERSAKRSDQKRSPDFSHLLGLTKRIIDRKDVRDVQNDYEPIDDEMEKTIEFRGSSKQKDLRRRQKYSAVRRIGGQTRRILSPPREWLPMTEEDVDKLKSDHRSLGGRRLEGKLQGVLADCQACRGSGLDTCIACLGAGWVPSLKEDDKMDEKRREILEEMWNRPNLVVDTEGEAQCIRCNGIGKQFCATCKGSGSTLRKGFSFSERDEVFDMFVNVDGAKMDDEDEYDGEDDEDDDDELDSFQLYRGSAETFDFTRKRRDGGDNTAEGGGDEVDVADVDDVIEVDDESAELLAALEAMHLADIEERKTGHRTVIRRSRVSRIHNDDDDDDEDDDDDDDADDVDDVDEVDDVDDVDDDVDDVDDDDFEVSMTHTDSEDLEDIDEEDDDFADLGEEDISVDVTLTGDEENDDNISEVDYGDYD